MIWYYIILFITNVFNAVFSFLPKVTQLPFGADAFLLTAVGYFNFVVYLVPPLGVMMQVFLAYMGFKVTLVILNLLKIYRSSAV